MKTQTIEVDDDTATALKQRAQERGVTVPELVAELVTLAVSPVDADAADIAELDRRWKAFEAQKLSGFAACSAVSEMRSARRIFRSPSFSACGASCGSSRMSAS